MVFGFFKKKDVHDVIANNLLKFAWDDYVGDMEANAVKASGIRIDLFKVEVLCLFVFSTIYAFSIWANKVGYPENDYNSIIEKFHANVKNQCEKMSKPREAFNLIMHRIKQYDAAQKIDMRKNSQGLASMELPSLFVSCLVNSGEEIPYEFMPSASTRFHNIISTVDGLLTKIHNA